MEQWSALVVVVGDVRTEWEPPTLRATVPSLHSLRRLLGGVLPLPDKQITSAKKMRGGEVLDGAQSPGRFHAQECPEDPERLPRDPGHGQPREVAGLVDRGLPFVPSGCAVSPLPGRPRVPFALASFGRATTFF